MPEPLGSTFESFRLSGKRDFLVFTISSYFPAEKLFASWKMALRFCTLAYQAICDLAVFWEIPSPGLQMLAPAKWTTSHTLEGPPVARLLTLHRWIPLPDQLFPPLLPDSHPQDPSISTKSTIFPVKLSLMFLGQLIRASSPNHNTLHHLWHYISSLHHMCVPLLSYQFLKD